MEHHNHTIRWQLKVLVVLISVAAVVEACLLLHLVAIQASHVSNVELMRENVELCQRNMRVAELYQQRTDQLCQTQNQIGESYRRLLVILIRDLGLDRRPTSATMVMLNEVRGMGGP